MTDRDMTFSDVTLQVQRVGETYVSKASGRRCKVVAEDDIEVTIRWLDTSYVSEQTITAYRFNAQFERHIPINGAALPNSMFFRCQAE